MSFRRPLRFAATLAALGVLGCHDSSDTRVSVQYVPVAGTAVAGFLAGLQAGQVSKSFVAPADSVPAPVFELETPESGFVVVSVALVDSLGSLGAAGATAIELRPDASYSVLVQIDSVNPATDCAACLGAKSIVLASKHQRVPKDSLWMVWVATSGGTVITR